MNDSQQTANPARESPPSGEWNDRAVFGRRDLRAILVGGVVVLLLYLFLVGRDTLYRPPAPPGPPPLRAVLVVGSVEVRPTKADGSRWDVGVGGMPDPCVTVVNRTEGARQRTFKVTDALTARFNYDTLPVKEGDSLYVRVDDIDLQFDDLIGEHRFEVTRAMIEEGEAVFQFGQVKLLALRFKPAD